MEQVTLYVIPQLAELWPRQSRVITIKRSNLGNTLPSEGTRALVATGRAGTPEAVEPFLFKVASTNNSDVQLTVETAYLNRVAIDRVRALLNRPLASGSNILQPGELERIIGLMGGVWLLEKELIAHVQNYITARGYYFDAETISNYHVCLKTRPFVILAGLSGTGKSKLSQLYAEAMGHTTQNGHYLRLAVRPSWNDDRYLLGYLNTLTGSYVMEPALEFIIEAEKDRDQLYFFCLDEMNLAHVEYYFSQFLSALEEDDPADRRIPLYGKSAEQAFAQSAPSMGPPREIILPPNLLFTGTINVDETTQPLSDKVIDRANTIEFFGVDFDRVTNRKPAPAPILVSATAWQSYIAPEPDISWREKLVEASRILRQGSIGFGYRVLREIEMYMANAAGLLAPEVAFDLQFKQRILPRVRGTAVLQPMFSSLKQFLKTQNLVHSLTRLDEMEQRLRRDGYTNFWR